MGLLSTKMVNTWVNMHIIASLVPSLVLTYYLGNSLNYLMLEEFQKPVKRRSTYFLDKFQIQSLYIIKTRNVAAMIFSG